MADNVPITAGSGTPIAADDVSGVWYQRVKLVNSTADSTTPTGVAADPLVVGDGGSTLSVDDGGGTLTVDNGGTFATQDSQILADNAGFTDGTSKVWPAGYIFDEVAGTALTENDVATPRIDSKRATVGVIEDATTRGRRAVVTASGELTVTGVVSGVQSINGHVPGGNSDQLGKAEDTGHSSGDTGVFVLAVRQSEANSLTSSAGSDGDYAAINGDARGLLQVVARPYVSRILVASSGLTTTSPAYTIGDTAGAIMTFAGCARVSGGTGTILSAVLLDKGDVGTDYRIHIYRASVTLASDNTAWSVSDSDQASLIGILTLPSMLDVGANRVSTLANIGLPYDCNATSLFVGIEARTANAVYAAATDLNLILTVALD